MEGNSTNSLRSKLCSGSQANSDWHGGETQGLNAGSALQMCHLNDVTVT